MGAKTTFHEIEQKKRQQHQRENPLNAEHQQYFSSIAPNTIGESETLTPLIVNLMISGLVSNNIFYWIKVKGNTRTLGLGFFLWVVHQQEMHFPTPNFTLKPFSSSAGM